MRPLYINVILDTYQEGKKKDDDFHRVVVNAML